MKAKIKVLVIGLDGATLNLIEPWVNRGMLPNLAKTIRNGVTAKLESVFPPVTSPAWASFMTGKNPGKHGIFDFKKHRGGSYCTTPVNMSDIHGKTLWKLLSEAGKKVIVINVPLTYPPEKINGILISGLLAPSQDVYSHPPKIAEELKKLGYRTYMNVQFYLTDKDTYLNDLFYTTNKRAEVALYLMEKYDWDFFMVVFMGTDWVQHFFWKYMDPNHPCFDLREAEKYKHAILKYYMRIDSIIGKFIENIDDNTLLMIMSDHGFGPLYKDVYINSWLNGIGLLKLRKQFNPFIINYLLSSVGLTQEKFLNWFIKFLPNEIKKLVPSMILDDFSYYISKMPIKFLSFSDIDWSKTKAYAQGHIGQIFINLKGREPEGIVEAGEEYNKLREILIKKLWELKDPETNEKILDKIFKKEEVYRGSYIGQAPDILFVMKDMSYVAWEGFQPKRNSFFGLPDNLESGSHRMEGTFIMMGKDIVKGQKMDNVKIVDLAPTILHIMGTPIPSDVDGNVLKSIFVPESGLAKKQAMYQAFDKKAEEKYVWTSEEEEEIKRRLKSLGYMG